MLALEHGDLSMAAYESQFISLSHFRNIMFQTEEWKGQMFEKGLRPQIQRYLVSNRFNTLRVITDVAKV